MKWKPQCEFCSYKGQVTTGGLNCGAIKCSYETMQEVSMKSSDAGFPDTNALSAWHNVQEFDDRVYMDICLLYTEEELYDKLNALLKRRLGCKEVKVWVLMEAKEEQFEKAIESICRRCGNLPSYCFCKEGEKNEN